MQKSLTLFLFCTALLFAAPPAPKLVVFLSVDQMRADYFDRYGHLFTDGLKMLHSKGIVFTNADLNYATSETGPGHATLGTGCYPSKSGIHGNEWIDPVSKKNVYCVDDSMANPVEGEGGGFSAKNLVVPAIGDWLKERSSRSKVISISAKDRAAILMGGWKSDGSYWYNKKLGRMVTSDYYRKTLPSWVKEFNSANWIEKNVPEAWTKSLPESAYTAFGPDEFPAELTVQGKTSFPHQFTPEKKNEQIVGTPYGDVFLLEFARAALNGERLGQREETDLLCVSLSNCDYVGHGYGPDSHEIIDLLVNLDRTLGDFFRFLDKTIGKNNYIVALSADHAVCPLPEFASQFRGIDAKRYNYKQDIKPKLDSLSILLKYERNSSDDIIIMNSFINYTAATKYGWDTLVLQQHIANGLKGIEAFSEVYFRHEMIGTDPVDKQYLQKYRNSYYAPRGEDFQYRIRENCIISSQGTGATHGSPYRYDTHVPLIFWWHGIHPQKIGREVHSADAAPTLAKIAGIPIPKHLDGVPLKEVVK
jgi:predicted AlkP superfamily pyrophosphatase or phosphodiesterase